MLSCADLGAALQSVGNNQTPSSSEMNGIVGYGRKAGGALTEGRESTEHGAARGRAQCLRESHGERRSGLP